MQSALATIEPPIIDVTGLCKSFAGKLVVDQVNLTINKGEIYGFLGPNGSGKTTTIRMLSGLLPLDSGQGSCLGFNVASQGNLIRLHVGYMTQKFSLYGDLTVQENLLFIARIFGIKNAKSAVEKAIDQLKIGSQRKKQKAAELSGGWKQRLALACATIHNPKLLLLDEPTAGVDPKARREFWDEIHRLSSEGVTTLVSTHYMDEAERCHKLAYIAYGKLLVEGTLPEILAKTDLITYEISGKKLHSLKSQLETVQIIEQVSLFGQTLHVSSVRDIDLKPTLKKLLPDTNALREITPTLEDVFIHLMNTNKDNFS